jgi:hypothetical protein
MRAFGRSLATAEAVAWALGIAAPVCVYLAAKRAVDPRAALAGAFLFALTPWGIWLGIAPVPEIPTAALAAVGVFVLGQRRLPYAAAWLGGGCALAASLSRYEAWPVAGVLVVLCIVGMRLRDDRRARFVAATLAAAGPAGWIAWNAHAHGDPLRFFHRVSRYHAAVGGGDASGERLLVYPAALAREAPDVAILLALALLGLSLPEPRRRGGAATIASLAVLAFLVAGSAAEGAPTHHAARALVIVFPLVAIAGADLALYVYSTRLRAAAPRWAARLISIAAFVAWLWWGSTSLARPPGASAAEDRAAQIARGGEIARRPGSGRLTVRPCAYEHFALIAALGAPERVTTLPSRGTPITPSCPEVTVDH